MSDNIVLIFIIVIEHENTQNICFSQTTYVYLSMNLIFLDNMGQKITNMYYGK